MTATLGYTIFYVGDVDATLSFYTDTFGLVRKFITPEGDYGELATGATALAFASTTLAHSNLDESGGFAPIRPDMPPVGASITFITGDVPGTVERAVDHGAELYTAVIDKPWGQTVAYVRDPNGILIEIATAIGES
jgi:lactoylglutathione lyase